MELSKRLQAVADMVTAGNRVADVGCDHGYVSIYLIQHGISPYVIAMDVNKGPLLRAKEHIEGERLTDYIELRLSGGVDALCIGEADTIICAGMGGRLMVRILEQDADVTSHMKEWVLQPQSELSLVRAYIRSRGCTIVDEKMIYEDGKFYPVIKVRTKGAEPAEVAEQPQTETDAGYDAAATKTLVFTPEDDTLRTLQDKFGPVLLQNKDAVLKDYLSEQQAKYEEIQSSLQQLHEVSQTDSRCADESRSSNTANRRRQRLTEIEQELFDIRQALAYYE